MGERLLCKQEVVGSSPITSTTCGPLVGAAGAEAAGDRRPGAGSRFGCLASWRGFVRAARAAPPDGWGCFAARLDEC